MYQLLPNGQMGPVVPVQPQPQSYVQYAPQPVPQPQPAPVYAPQPAPQQQVAQTPQVAQNATQEPQSQNLAQQREELNKYKSQLIAVHNELKRKNDILDALDKSGIKSVNDFNAFKANQTTSEGGVEGSGSEGDFDSIFGTGEEGNKKASEKDKEIEALKEMVFKQQHYQEKQALKEEIKEVLNPSEYPMLSKKLDDSALEQIMRVRYNYQNQYKQELPLNEALKFAEGNIQNFFKTYGGTVPQPPLAGLQQRNNQQAQPQNQAQQSQQLPNLPAPPAQAQAQQNLDPHNIQVPQSSPAGPQLPQHSSGENAQRPAPEPVASSGFKRQQALNDFMAENGLEI